MVEGPELTNIVQTLHCQCYIHYVQFAIGRPVVVYGLKLMKNIADFN